MATTGMTRVLALLSGQGTPQAAADAAAAVLGVSGLSGCVLASARGPEPAWGTGISGELEDLKFTLGRDLGSTLMCCSTRSSGSSVTVCTRYGLRRELC